MGRLLKTGLLAALYAAATTAAAQNTALDRLKAYVEIDTTNPPGNEIAGARYLAGILETADIGYEIVESSPGRGNVWARLDGGDEPGLILLHHIDVVPATRDAWRTDPLRAVEQDGYLAGRGTLDTKALGIIHLEALLALKRRGKALNRDVMFLATADEEAGGLLGAGWLLENRPEIFRGMGYLLNEGGVGIRTAEHTRFQVEVAQKRPYWLRLTAADEPGHGSSPRPTSAPGRLIAALHRIQTSPFEPRLIEPVRAMFLGIAPSEAAHWRAPLQNIDQAIKDAGFLARLQAQKPGLHALTRNTCSITMLSGSQKINVVPPMASAELDCRILPDQDAAEFIAAIRDRVADDQIQVEEIMLFAAAQSPTDTELFRLLEQTNGRAYAGVPTIPGVSSGFTDSHFFRDVGIVSYGYSPVVIAETDLAGVHGNNERISIDAFNKAVQMMTDIVASFAAP
jgi:acetylornithine deacetylase/succinyl-diaminopimelate desuccinylase-like protein